MEQEKFEAPAPPVKRKRGRPRIDSRPPGGFQRTQIGDNSQQDSTTGRIMENIELGMPKSWVDIADELNIRPESVYRRVYQLEKQGRLKRGQGAIVVKTRRRNVDYGALLKEAERDGILSNEQLLKVASQIVLQGSSREQIAAAALINKLQPPDKEKIGPPSPQNEKEATVRLSFILASCAPHIRRAALELAEERDHIVAIPTNDKLAQETQLQDSNSSVNHADDSGKVA